jgi:hypothetical protein
VVFEGFGAEDFEVFSIPDFAARMGEIRARVRPKLLALGEDLCGSMEEALGSPLFPHVAQHMRRRVHPPEETWAAFARDRKGYKRWTHYRIAVGKSGVRVAVFVEDDADDKAQMGANLAEAGGDILRRLGSEAPLRWSVPGGEVPIAQASVTPEMLRQLGSALQLRKGLKFQTWVPLSTEAAIAMGPERFEAWALEQVRLLKPLYLAGTEAHYRP